MLSIFLGIYYFLLNCYRFIRQKIARFLFYKKATRIIQARNTLKISEIDKLAADIPQNYYFAFTPEKYTQNDYYGIATSIKQYAGLPRTQYLNLVVEHGPYLETDDPDFDINSTAPAILTLSSYRKKRLQKITPKKVHCIGPFIFYAPHFLTATQLKREKKRLGNNLLVFPAHSFPGYDSIYEIDKFCKCIKKIGKDFDSVRICLYWKDIIMGRSEQYKGYGFECVTAGHMFDPLFLSRLKSIIEISTMVISNGVGTHIGYCILMEKPHFFFKQEIKLNQEMFPENDDIDRIINTFDKFSNKITRKQREIIDYYWGTSQLKNPTEIKTIINRYKKTI